MRSCDGGYCARAAGSWSLATGVGSDGHRRPTSGPGRPMDTGGPRPMMGLSVIVLNVTRSTISSSTSSVISSVMSDTYSSDHPFRNFRYLPIKGKWLGRVGGKAG